MFGYPRLELAHFLGLADNDVLSEVEDLRIVGAEKAGTDISSAIACGSMSSTKRMFAPRFLPSSSMCCMAFMGA